MNQINKLFEHFGSQQKLAKALGIKRMAVNHWKTRGIPGARAVQIEQLTDGKFKAVDLIGQKDAA